MTTRIEIRTSEREIPVEITSEVADVVSSSGVRDGVAVVFCPHTTAGIVVNEHADPDVLADLYGWLAKTAGRHDGWHHREGNADAHVKASIVGSGATLPVEGGRLALGTWQGIFFCEFDGPRSRHVLVTVLGE